MSRLRLMLGGLAALCLAAIGLHLADAAISTSEIRVKFSATQTGSNNVLAPTFAPTIDKVLQFSSGTGSDQYDILWVDKRTLAASGTEDLDLTGTALKSAFNANIACAEVVGIVVVAEAANTNDVLIGGAGSNGWTTMFGDATDVIKVKPGGVFANFAHDATGLGTVTASTGDLLHIANSSSGTGVTYTIAVACRSA